MLEKGKEEERRRDTVLIGWRESCRRRREKERGQREKEREGGRVERWQRKIGSEEAAGPRRSIERERGY